MKKRFKLRISYFIIVGLIGVVLQAIGFFMWKYSDRVFSQIKSSSSMEYFNQYMVTTYFILFSALCIIGMCVGIMMGCRKDEKGDEISFKLFGKEIKFEFNKGQRVTKYSSLALAIEQCILITTSICFLIVSIVGRKTMDEGNTKIALDVFVSIKNVMFYVSSITSTLLLLTLLGINKKDRPLSKIGVIVALCSNCLFIVAYTALFFASIGTPSYEFISKFFEYSTVISDKFGSKYPTMNGFTLGTLQSDFAFIQQIEMAYPGKYGGIIAGSWFACITIITFAISIVGDFVGLVLYLVESFDVSRDKIPMNL